MATKQFTMWQRLVRLLITGFNISSFYTNPVRYIFSILIALLIPYLAYIFWGTVVILALIVLGIYLLYLALKESRKNKTAI